MKDISNESFDGFYQGFMKELSKNPWIFFKLSLENIAKKNKKISGRKCGYISEETTNRIIKAMGDFH